MIRTRRMDCGPWRVLLILFSFAVLCVFATGSARAADQPPNGTYKKTCKNINFSASQNKILGASCKRLNGSWKPAQFTGVNECLSKQGDIENCDGTIECTGIGIPNVGSYKKSCFCCKMDGATLRCYCITKKNVSRQTSLPNASSYRDIWNDNGVLKGR